MGKPIRKGQVDVACQCSGSRWLLLEYLLVMYEWDLLVKYRACCIMMALTTIHSMDRRRLRGAATTEHGTEIATGLLPSNLLNIASAFFFFFFSYFLYISCGLLYRKVPTLQQTEHRDISLVNGFGELRCGLLLCGRGRKKEAHEGGSGQALWQNGIQDNGQEEDRRRHTCTMDF